MCLVTLFSIFSCEDKSEYILKKKQQKHDIKGKENTEKKS